MQNKYQKKSVPHTYILGEGSIYHLCKEELFHGLFQLGKLFQGPFKQWIFAVIERKI